MGIFQDLVEARGRLASEVAIVLASLDRGEPPPQAESEHVDCKEEPGRRGRGGILLPGETTNHAAAHYLAREVCCLANTPGGGALILGVEDGTWQALGTRLDPDWLRHRIYQLSDIAPAIEERHVAGQRVLIVFVAESPEPIEDPDGKIRWRVGAACVPVDRAEWWLRRQQRSGLDVMAATTSRTVDEVSAGSLVVARRYLRDGGDAELAAVPVQSELIRRLGVLTPEGNLTQAGVLMFVPAGRPLVELARFDVLGGEVIGRFEPAGELALIEQIAEVEARLDAYNPVNPISRGLTEAPVRSLPVRTVREAVLNGLAHRDWITPEPTTITWIAADSRLEVVSPGGFTGGVTAENVLTQRHARYPALSDLFRALRLVDKQGVGVDRMYREMIVLGHRPPQIAEQPGPRVRTVLVGGAPVVPVVTLVESLRPELRQRDVRIAVLIYELLHRPFLTVAQAAAALQNDLADAELALETAGQTIINDQALVTLYKDVYLLSTAAIARVESSTDTPAQLARRGILTYHRPGTDKAPRLVRQWLAVHDRITSGDYAAMTGIARPNASRVLNGLVGDLLERGEEARGRRAHFVLRGQT
jgi:ATP-dependent DNA helicase RecG